MTEKDMAEVTENEKTVETLEFTDEKGQNHCFLVERRFKVGNDEYAALLEVDPAIFEEEACGCGHDHAHDHAHAETCGCGHDHDTAEEEDEDVDEGLNVILAKIVTDENGELDIEAPTDAEFEKARITYEALEE